MGRRDAVLRFFMTASCRLFLSRKGIFMTNPNASLSNTTALARGAIIAALYAATTLLLAPISYGEIQVRLSESLTLLPILLPEAVPALTIGCLLANVLGGCTIFDIVFGTLATLLAAICTRCLRSRRSRCRFWPAQCPPRCRRCGQSGWCSPAVSCLQTLPGSGC